MNISKAVIEKVLAWRKQARVKWLLGALVAAMGAAALQ